MDFSFKHTKHALRQHLRAQRRQYSAAHQQRAAQRLAYYLQRLVGQHRWQHVALYWPSDGEIDPSLFARYLQRRGVRLYLPVVLQRHGLRFVEAPAQAFSVRHRQQLRQQRWPGKRNRYGLREPIGRGAIAAHQLDALLMPLVGFDRQGQRLGMGGGFYDRVVARLHRRVRRPQLIGLAHAAQEHTQLVSEPWDQAVDVVVTDAGHRRR